MQKIFDKEDLYDMEIPYEGSAVVSDTIVDTSRWSEHHRVIFEYEGKHWEVYYSRGLTEQQDESPWDYEDHVTCTEVEAKEITVIDWVAVK